MLEVLLTIYFIGFFAVLFVMGLALKPTDTWLTVVPVAVFWPILLPIALGFMVAKHMESKDDA